MGLQEKYNNRWKTRLKTVKKNRNPIPRENRIIASLRRKRSKFNEN